MVFTYTKATKTYIDYDNDRVYEDVKTIDYEPSYEELKKALADILTYNATNGKLAEYEYKIIVPIVERIVDDITDLSDLFESYEDELKEYFETDAWEQIG